MEQMLHIPEKSSNEIVKKVYENLNYIYIVLMIIANFALSLLNVDDGQFSLIYPKTFLGWTLWFVQIAISVFIGVMILNSFRRQGIKRGKADIKNTYDKYLDTLVNSKNGKPRSEKDYLRQKNLKDSLVKSGIYVVLSVFVGSVIISADWNSLLSLIINVIFSVSFGIKALLDAEEFVITELVLWYQQKINEAEKSLEETKNGI